MTKAPRTSSARRIDPRIKLRHLRTLVAVAEHGSLGRAALELAVTQPAVSKTVMELEAIVGRPLLERSRKGVFLTVAGRTLLRYVGSSLRTLHEGLDSLVKDRMADAPRITIGALPNVAATVLPEALHRCMKETAYIRLNVISGSNSYLLSLLRRGDIDLVVGRLSEPADMQGLSFEPMYTEPLLMVVRPGHELASKSRVSVHELIRYRLVLPTVGTRIRDPADQFFLAAGLGLPDDFIETTDTTFGRTYVLDTDAIWCVPLGVVERDLRSGVLARLSIDTEGTTGPVGITLRSDRAPSSALTRTITEIRNVALERSGRLQCEPGG